MPEGFDSLVDRIMACEGLDRDEAEIEAERRLARLVQDMRNAREFECDVCECGGCCEDCQ